MKKWMTAAVCMTAAVMLLTGCSNTQKADDSSGETIDAMAEPELEDLNIELGNYKGIQVTVPAIADITDTDVETQLQSMVDNGTEVIEVTDRAVADGDLVNIDYQGYLDGTAISEEKENDYNVLIGSGVFFNGAEQELVGVMPGQTKEVNITFPEGYPNESLAGKDAVYEVTVNYIQEEGSAELTDEYVQSITDGECQTVDEYKTMLKEDMQAGIDAQKELLAQQAVWDQLIADTVVENYPEDLLKAKEEAYKQNDQEGAELEGISFEDYVEQNLNMTLDEYNQEVSVQVGNAAKKQVIAEAIAREEGLTIDTLNDDDWQEAARWYGYDNIDQLKENYTEQEVKNDLTIQRVTDLLMETAVVEESAEEQQ